MYDFCSDYDFEINRIVSSICRHKAKRVVLQAAEGFQRCLTYIVEEIRDRIKDVEVFVSANPSYGSCLVDEFSVAELNADLLIHIGHDEYPFYKPRIPVVFVRAEYRYSEDVAKALSEIVDEDVCVVSSYQHVQLAQRIAQEKRAKYLGIVLGCVQPDVRGCKRIVVVAGGDFHCVALALKYYNAAEHILCFDPYTSRQWSVTKEVEHLLRVRMWKVFRCIDARKWLIVDGFYGQSRPKLVNEIVDRIRALGGTAVVAKALRIDEAVLRNLGVESFDCVVITACPRIAIDDLSKMETPVLTPGEALMVLNRRFDRYVYPW